MIQNYLEANLIVITDDNDVKKLKKAAEQVFKNLAKNKKKIISYTLSAIDPNTPADNTEIVEVKDIITKSWPTFTGNAKDTPVTYIRAVIFEALTTLSEDRDYANLIWLASRNAIKYFKLIGNEKDIVHEFIKKLGNEINQLAIKEWALNSKATLSKVEIKLKDIVRYGLNDDILVKYLEDAVGPTNKEGKANYESPNPYWVNDTNNWTYAFPTRAAKGIKITVEACLKAIVTIINENKDLIEDALLLELEKMQQQVISSNKSLALRSELLWWKEAAYSASTDKSYHEINKEVLGPILAFDYSVIIPPVFPRSVDHFLIGTYKGLGGLSTDEQSIRSFLENFEPYKEELKSVLPETDLSAGKITLLEYITGLVFNNSSIEEFEKRVGISLDTKIREAEFITWLFHDVQLSKILKEK
ncbi:GTPase-associated system all-helical protein GASH [Chryseobacterium arthrosphaerae]|uniref:GTPase-associated system all-helical protein GASH n=1 Tax=Chryseobacterium arthrosphaerae TaxID=651561 RepID=UPI001F4BAAE0|nr:GTPase-associated system all-helical protein GASH [Chryseobacterium arthrosphaerae]